jgi:hypothetical protein
MIKPDASGPSSFTVSQANSFPVHLGAFIQPINYKQTIASDLLSMTVGTACLLYPDGRWLAHPVFISDDWRQERTKRNWKSSQRWMPTSGVARKMKVRGEENILSRLILDGAYICFHLSDVFLDSV